MLTAAELREVAKLLRAVRRVAKAVPVYMHAEELVDEAARWAKRVEEESRAGAGVASGT